MQPWGRGEAPMLHPQHYEKIDSDPSTYKLQKRLESCVIWVIFIWSYFFLHQNHKPGGIDRKRKKKKKTKNTSDCIPSSSVPPLSAFICFLCCVLSIYLPIYPSIPHPFIHLPTYSSIHPPIHLPTYPSIPPSIHPPTHTSIYYSSSHSSIHPLPIDLSFLPSVSSPLTLHKLTMFQEKWE